MKHLIKLMTAAFLGAALLTACNQGKKDEPIPEKPVVTSDMYSVTADAESGEVVFRFTADGLSPFWTVTEPSGLKSTFTDRDVTKTYKVKGVYNGTIVAYGTGGQSDPVAFSFTIGNATPVDPSLSPTENILISETWKILTYGYYGGEGEEYWEWYDSSAPASAADDRLTFGKGGAFTLDLGENKSVYNDEVGLVEEITVTGNEKWAYVNRDGAEYIQFSAGGFPGMLGNDAGVNGEYLISDLSAEGFSLCYKQSEEQWFVVVLVPDWYEKPAEGVVTEAMAKSALSGKTFQVSDLGWWGEGWEYFTVAEEGEEALPVILVNDFVTFSSDGSLGLDLGIDEPVEEGGQASVRVYNDGVENGEAYTVSGSPKWSVTTDGGVTVVQFSGGGFPLTIAGAGEKGDPNYHFGVDGKWKVTSIDEDGTVRLDIEQTFNEQWFTVFLTPSAK